MQWQVDLLGMSIYDFTHPTDQQKIQSFITRYGKYIYFITKFINKIFRAESAEETCLPDHMKGPR